MEESEEYIMCDIDCPLCLHMCSSFLYILYMVSGGGLYRLCLSSYVKFVCVDVVN